MVADEVTRRGRIVVNRAGGRLLKVVPSELARNLLVELRESEREPAVAAT